MWKSFISFQVTKRSIQSLEEVTLEHIIHLSTRSIFSLFADLTSDEIKRLYTYHCFLMPDKCQEQFSSFGNETRARIQMMKHLDGHIHTLTERANGLYIILWSKSAYWGHCIQVYVEHLKRWQINFLAVRVLLVYNRGFLHSFDSLESGGKMGNCVPDLRKFWNFDTLPIKTNLDLKSLAEHRLAQLNTLPSVKQQ